MIPKFTAWVERRRTPPAARPAETPIHAQRRRSAGQLNRSIKAERRQSAPIQRERPTENVEKESKKVRHARKQKSRAAAALNLFPLDRRLEMLELAAQLSDYNAVVEPTWVAMNDDARGPRFAHFTLQLNEAGEIFVEKKLRRRVDPVAVLQEPAHVFSPIQVRLGTAQLRAAFIWQSENDAGFHQAPPDFAPLSVAAALSED